jgi:outer membrane protein assembly factor BamD (BamD/ComL family)
MRFVAVLQSVRRPVGDYVRCLVVTLFACALATATGCSWDDWYLFKPPPAPPPPADSLTLRGDKLEADAAPVEGSAAADLEGAKELYRQNEFSKAERIFRKIADNTKNTPQVAEEARYYQAECLRHEQRYPKAADVYHKLLTDFPSGAYRDQAVQHMFEIANYWLDDTRKEMELEREKKEGKRWFVWPDWVHWEKEKPLLDEEGRAIEKLEQVRYNDMTGPLADRALFLAASVKFYRGDYKEADFYYSQIVEMHPNSPFVEQAIELATISKQLSTGGALYDSRKLCEARKMIDLALRSYPNLASKKGDFLNRQLFSITMQEAEKDYQTAEFFRRTGHPCSAYFYYEIVRRRYPGTKYFDMATERMEALRVKLEKAPPEEHHDGLPPAKFDNRTLPAPNLPGPEMAPAPRLVPPEMMK